MMTQLLTLLVIDPANQPAGAVCPTLLGASWMISGCYCRGRADARERREGSGGELGWHWDVGETIFTRFSPGITVLAKECKMRVWMFRPGAEGLGNGVVLISLPSTYPTMHQWKISSTYNVGRCGNETGVCSSHALALNATS